MSFARSAAGRRACPSFQLHIASTIRASNDWSVSSPFLLTFTVPEALRALVWANQQALYDHLIGASWETVRNFARNDTALQGEAGAIAVLDTHSRRLDSTCPPDGAGGGHRSGQDAVAHHVRQARLSVQSQSADQGLPRRPWSSVEPVDFALARPPYRYRVAAGAYAPAAPTDPDVRDYRIRLLD
nr:hypothetical protein [Thiocystis violacea]